MNIEKKEDRRRKKTNDKNEDQNKNKISFNDLINIKNFGKNSNLNAFLKENKDNILKFLELFQTMQKIGKEGQKNFEKLEKLNPSNKEEDSKSNNEIDTASQIKNNDNIGEIFSDFESKKENLIRIYKRLQSTVGGIYGLGDDPDKYVIKDDMNYIFENSKFYDNLLEEMFPLFDQIHAQTQHFAIVKIIKNLRRISDILREKDVGFKNFFVLTQSLINRIPPNVMKSHILCDMMGDDEDEDIDKRKKMFCEILEKEKSKLIDIIGPTWKEFFGEKNGNNTDAITNENNEE